MTGIISFSYPDDKLPYIKALKEFAKEEKVKDSHIIMRAITEYVEHRLRFVQTHIDDEYVQPALEASHTDEHVTMENEWLAWCNEKKEHGRF